jgi:hypothetical protein
MTLLPKPVIELGCDLALAAVLSEAAAMRVRAVDATAAAAPSAKQAAVERLKSDTDPTILMRRVWLETEWNSYRDGSDNVEETLGGLWAWRLTDNADWAVRLKLPYEWHFAGHDPGDSDEHGFGDIKVATGGAHRFSETLSAGGGLELRMPTAEDDLGDDVWKLQEFGTLAWDATRWLSLTPTFEYNQSVAEEDDASPQHNVELFAPATVILPHNWSVTARYEAKIDFEDDNYVTQSGKLYLSKAFQRVPISFTASIKKPFNTGNKDYQVNFMVTYFFQSKKPQ